MAASEEGQPQRSVSRKFYKQLSSELEVWKQQGTVSSEQADTILANYVVLSPLYGRLIVILLTLGAVLAGVGAILFVSANWQAIPRLGKVALLVVVFAGIAWLGYWLKYERNYPRAGGALLFVGSMVFGAAIFLVGQQYHMPVDDPKLLTWWFVGVIPLAYFTRSKAILTLAILALLGGLGYKVSHWLEGIQNTAYGIFCFYLVLGLLLYGIGALHSRFERLRYYTPRYHIIGLILIFGVLYILSFKGIYNGLDIDSWITASLSLAFIITFHVVAALAVICAVWSLIIDADRKSLAYTSWSDLAGIVVFVAIAYLAFFLPAKGQVSYALLFNLVLFAGIIGLIFLGYFRGEGSFVNIALVLFGLAVISRYFDFAWDLLPRSVLFIFGGFLLIGGGILLERLRRKTLKQMRAIEVGEESEA